MVETSIRIPTRRELVQERHAAPAEAARLNDHAHDLARQGKIAAAVTALRRAQAMAPDHPILLSCLGAVLYDACEYQEAERVLSRAIAIEPEYAPARGNLGSVLGGLGRYDEAHAAFRVALELEPDYIDARWNYAMSLLDAGKWLEAWPYYEARFDRGDFKHYPKLPYPTWRGEDLNGKTLYVQGEQGVGDRTLFSRYLHWIKAEFPEARILYMLNAEDLPNVSNFMWGFRGVVDEFLPNGIPWPEADFGIYLMSLPGLHGTMPANVYADPGLIKRSAERHRNSVVLPQPNGDVLKVGVAWTGNPGMKRNNERAIPFDQILELAELPSVLLYSLQHGAADLAATGAGEQLICDIAPDCAPFGFTGTAAAMQQLDLVITCCTSVAHVAGSLGVPCWVPLCANPYWIWLRGRSDSVWYESVRLFRQSRMHDWRPVMGEVRQELAALASHKSLRPGLAA